MFKYGIYGWPGGHCFVTPELPITGGETTFALPQDRWPDLVETRVVCYTPENGWLVGDELDARDVLTSPAGVSIPVANVGFTRGDGNSRAGLVLSVTDSVATYYAMNRYGGGGARPVFTRANWMVKAIAIWFHP